MEIEQAKSLIKNKRITLNGKTYHFEANGKLMITDETQPLRIENPQVKKANEIR